MARVFNINYNSIHLMSFDSCYEETMLTSEFQSVIILIHYTVVFGRSFQFHRNRTTKGL